MLRGRNGCGAMSQMGWRHSGILCKDDKEVGLRHPARRSRVYVAQSIKYSNATQPGIRVDDDTRAKKMRLDWGELVVAS